MSVNNICIEVKNVSFNYQKEPILEDVSFKVKNGDYLGIIGPNGSGKTTLLKIILGLLMPSSGEVKIFGEKIESFKKRYQIGYVSQKVSQNYIYFPASVEEVVMSGRVSQVGVLHRFKKEDYQAKEWAMEIANVTKYKHKLISELSGGEKQRVFIARALVSQPKVLILDEPTVGVDIVSQEKFYAFLKKINQQLGLTIIFVTHEIDTIANEAEYVLCLNRKLVCHTFPKNLLKKGYLEKLYGGTVKKIRHDH